MSDDVRDELDFEPEEELGATHAAKAKLAKVRDELENVKKERAEYLDGWQRCKAEMVNYRREAEEARTRAAELGRENFIASLIPALDSFDMAMQGDSWNTVESNWRIGVESIRAQIESVLQEHGVESFGKVGDPFDPLVHEPIQEEQGGPSHTIARIFRKGYRSKHRVVRPAQVAVYA